MPWQVKRFGTESLVQVIMLHFSEKLIIIAVILSIWGADKLT